MPPAKQPRGESPANDERSGKKGRSDSSCVLQATYLRSSSSDQLVSRMLECGRVLDEAKAPFAVDKAFVEEVLKKEYTTSGNADVQVVAACIISDILRLAAPAVPFAHSHYEAVVGLFSTVLSKLRAKSKATQHTFCRHLLDILAASHALVPLLQHAACDDATTQIFDTLLNHVAADDESMTAHMAGIISDVISATQSVTETQLSLLMNAISLTGRTSTGFLVASSVLRRHDALMQSVVAAYVTSEFEAGAEELHNVDVTDGELNERKAALKHIASSLEIAVELSKISTNVVSQVVPFLQRQLSHDSNEVRLLVTRGLAKSFGAVVHLTQDFSQAFHQFLARAHDARPIVRLEIVKFAQQALTAHRNHEPLWQSVAPLLESKLLDSDESVRRAAVAAVCELAQLASMHMPGKLLEAVGQRCSDKIPKVRQLAVEKLSALYKSNPLRWIPDAIFAAAYADGEASIVEIGLEGLLPSPAAVGAKSKRGRAIAVFDFEEEDGGAAAGEAAASASGTYVDGLIRLCGDMSATSWSLFSTLMGKKQQLRTAVLRLFEFRTQVRTIDIKTTEGQVVVNSINRLVNFLQAVTHAKKKEWDTLFVVKDEKIAKLFTTVCAPDCVNFVTALDELAKKSHGKVSADAQSFIETSLTKRLAIPFSLEHVDELMARIEAPKGATTGALRTLLAVTKMAQQYVPHVIDKVVALLQKAAENANADPDTARNLLSVLLQVDVDESGDVPPVLAKQSKQIITTIGRLCVGSSTASVGKQAALCLRSIFRNHDVAFKQLLTSCRDKLRAAVDQGTLPYQCASWLKTIAVLAERVRDGEDAIEEVATMLQLAVRTPSTSDGVDFKKAGTSAAVYLSTSCDIVDAAAKALVKLADALPGAKKAAVAPRVFETLLAAMKGTRELGSTTIGACRKRLSLNKQLAKLLLVPSHDCGKEIQFAVLLSSEDNTDVRQALQAKMSTHITKMRTDTRFVALLLVSAIGEDTRGTYNNLKSHVQTIGDKLRSFQQQHEVTLSETRGLSCFLEYAIPTIVLVLAHHSFYPIEKDQSFIGFQRVWHLLFDELFRAGTNCASFAAEIFRKIRALDDSLDPDSTATRTMCDLGVRVMLEILGQKAAGSEASKAYPGVVLMPKFFVKPRDAGRFPVDQVYLDSSVRVSAHVPFKFSGPSITPAKQATSTVRGAAEGDEGGAFDPFLEEGPSPSTTTKKRDALASEAASPAPKLKGPDQAVRKVKMSASQPLSAEEQEAETIANYIRNLCASLTRTEIENTSWKNVKAPIEKLLGHPLTDNQRTMARAVLVEALDD